MGGSCSSSILKTVACLMSAARPRSLGNDFFEHRQLVQSRPIALSDNVFLLKCFDEWCDRVGKIVQWIVREDVINEKKEYRAIKILKPSKV